MNWFFPLLCRRLFMISSCKKKRTEITWSHFLYDNPHKDKCLRLGNEYVWIISIIVRTWYCLPQNSHFLSLCYSHFRIAVKSKRLFEHNFQLWLWKVTQAHAMASCEFPINALVRHCSAILIPIARPCIHVIMETSSGKNQIVRDDSSNGNIDKRQEFHTHSKSEREKQKKHAIKSYYTTHSLTRTHTFAK